MVSSGSAIVSVFGLALEAGFRLGAAGLVSVSGVAGSDHSMSDSR